MEGEATPQWKQVITKLDELRDAIQAVNEIPASPPEPLDSVAAGQVWRVHGEAQVIVEEVRGGPYHAVCVNTCEVMGTAYSLDEMRERLRDWNDATKICDSLADYFSL